MNEEDEIFLHEMINTMIYIYLAISSGMEKNPTYIYIFSIGQNSRTWT